MMLPVSLPFIVSSCCRLAAVCALHAVLSKMATEAKVARETGLLRLSTSLLSELFCFLLQNEHRALGTASHRLHTVSQLPHSWWRLVVPHTSQRKLNQQHYREGLARLHETRPVELQASNWFPRCQTDRLKSLRITSFRWKELPSSLAYLPVLESLDIPEIAFEALLSLPSLRTLILRDAVSCKLASRIGCTT